MKNNGFTLVELMIVVAILGIPLAIAIPAFTVKRNMPQTQKVAAFQTGVKFDSNFGFREIVEYTYQGCQYVCFYNGNRTWGAHKGNCNNPIHQYKVEK